MLRALLIRFGLPTLALLFIATYFTVPFVENILAGWFRSDVEMRARLVMNSVEKFGQVQIYHRSITLPKVASRFSNRGVGTSVPSETVKSGATLPTCSGCAPRLHPATSASVVRPNKAKEKLRKPTFL